MISETRDLLGLIEDKEIDISMPIQKLFDECLSFISITDFE